MKKSVLIGIGLVLGSIIGLKGQGPTYSSGAVLTFGGTLPATCNVGELYAKNTATVSLNVCTASNTWTAVSTGSSSILPLHLTDANTVSQYNGTSAQGFYLYNNFTATEYLRLLWSGGNAFYQTVGSNLGMTFLATGTVTIWNNNHSGNFQEIYMTTTGLNLTSVGGTPVQLITSPNGNTSNTYNGTNVTATFNPTLTSTMVSRGLYINPTINYSAGTPGAGSYEALTINAVETALPTGTSYLIRAAAGSAGNTDKFTVTNLGAATLTPTAGNGALTLTGATETTSQPLVNATQTWNASGTTFTAIDLNVTNTASASGSLLMNLRVGGTSFFSVDKFGGVTAPGTWTQGTNGTAMSSGFVRAAVNGGFSIGSSTSPTGAADVLLVRDAANTLALRNSTNAQVFNLYNTYTSSTNNELANLLWSSNVFHIGTNKGSGGGTARVMQLDYGGTTTSAISIPITSGVVTFGGGITGSSTGIITGFHFTGNGTAPTVASTTSNSCGTTSPAIAGTDQGGKVTVGATSGTSCTVTFGTAWANAPSCWGNNETTANLMRSTSTTTTLVLAGTMAGGDVLSYGCFGY